MTATDGYDGINCETDGVSLGCTVNDITLAGQSKRRDAEGQHGSDILARDFAAITLSSGDLGVRSGAATDRLWAVSGETRSDTRRRPASTWTEP